MATGTQRRQEEPTKRKNVRKKIVHLKSCAGHQSGDNGSLKAI